MDFAAGQRVRIKQLSTAPKEDPVLVGHSGVVADPPYSEPHGYLRVYVEGIEHLVSHGLPYFIHPENVDRLCDVKGCENLAEMDCNECDVSVCTDHWEGADEAGCHCHPEVTS